MNCYGYAMGFLLDSPAYVKAYKQLIGEFSSTNRWNIEYFYDQIDTYSSNSNFHDLVSYYYNQMMEYDSNEIGYTIEEFTPISSTVEQSNINQKIIAMTTGYNDYQHKYTYHFYVQNNDGTWSHKPGEDNISNLSFDDGRILTNENIITKAKQGMYENGVLRFYKVTKDSVIDTMHLSRGSSWPASNSNYSHMVECEKAGDYYENALEIVPCDHEFRINYDKDHDCYFIPITETGNYTIKAIPNYSSYTLKYVLTDRSGNYIGDSLSTNSNGISAGLYAGSQYYLDIYCTNNNFEYASLEYELQIE